MKVTKKRNRQFPASKSWSTQDPKAPNVLFDGECVTWSALELTLQVSRVLGVAPLRMDKKPRRWRVQLSTAWTYYSYTLFAVLHTCALISFLLDLHLEPRYAMHAISPISIVLYVIKLLIITAITTEGCFGAIDRMRSVVVWLNVIQNVYAKINTNMTNLTKIAVEKRRYIATLLILVFVKVSFAGNFSFAIYKAFIGGQAQMAACFYLSTYVLYVTVLILELQFISVALHVHSTLQAVNDSLQDLVQTIDSQARPGTTIYRRSTADSNNIALAINASILMESFATDCKPVIEGAGIEKMRENISRHIVAFCTVCDVIRQVNRSFGKLALFLSLFLFIHLFSSLFYLVFLLISKKMETTWQILVIIMQAMLLVIFVDPGHRTQRELSRTSVLVGQLLRRFPASGPDDSCFLELDLFSKQLALNKLSYSAVGMYTIGRPLITAVLGGVTTTLITVLQLLSIT